MADTGIAMRASGAGDTSEETLLVERLRKVSDNPTGYFAVHLHLSRLRPSNRQPHFLDIAKRSFDALVMSADAALFSLSNCDMVLICRNVPVDDLDVPISKVRGLFREDPVTAVDESGFEEDRFTTWYDLASKEDRAKFVAVANQLLADAVARKKKAAAAASAESAAAKGTPLTPANLADINRKIQAVRIVDLVREQAAVLVRAGGKGQILFRENFVAMAELKERVAPGVNLFASTWLFQFLTETLDKRVLAVVAQRNLAAMRDALSLNLNVGTVLSRDFQSFHQAAGSYATKIVIEMQVVDIFADMNMFAFARDSLQQRGYRVLVDGLNPLSLQFFDPSNLKADFVKIAWGPEFAGETPDSRVQELREVVAHTGKDGVIISRVDSEHAIKWGLTLGITRFQGRFIDRLVQAAAWQGPR